MNPLLAFSIYLLPSIIAAFRCHKNLTPIVAINILTGLTIAGWFVSFIWALTSNVKTESVKACAR